MNFFTQAVAEAVGELDDFSGGVIHLRGGQLSTSKVESSLVLDQFKNINEYYQFVFDNADYQKTLEEIKKQLLE